MNNEIVIVSEAGQAADVLERDDALPELGQWYWTDVKIRRHYDDDDEETIAVFVCVTHVGSNYVEVTAVEHEGHQSSWRVHFDDLDTLRRERDPDKVFAQAILRAQDKVRGLMDRVRQVTAQLGVTPLGALPAASEVSALARVSAHNADFPTYKTALTRAKEETLPELFKQIKVANEHLVTWMKGQVIPLEAQSVGMHGVIGRIDDRIFNVELYAGLSEHITQIADGPAADLTEKVRLFQRKHFMDEEALLRYETGGMDFRNIRDFDAWMAKPENRDRVLPFPRCIVSFQVRRFKKEREVPDSFIAFFHRLDEIKADTLTFLYIRNGERLYRMATALDFGGVLFPHFDHDLLSGKVWGVRHGSGITSIIGDNDHNERQQAAEKEKERRRKIREEHNAKVAAWQEREKEAEARGEDFDERAPGYLSSMYEEWYQDRVTYEPFDPSSVYFDDIKKKIDKDIQDHNRVVLVLQGLLDRSPVLQPHPPWQLWSDDGMTAGVDLVFDNSTALVSGPAPDFEAYRNDCNARIGPGSVTVGQQEAWEEEQASIFNRANGYERHRSRHTPYGNHGPGTLAIVDSFSKKKRECTYAWNRDSRSRGTYGDTVRTTGTVSVDLVFNVSAYKPGDFRTFFADPRTRAEYVKWAPFLLEAEEYHAGNRHLKPPAEKRPRAPATPEAQAKYRRTRLLNALREKLVTNKREFRTRGGEVFPKGTIFRVLGTSRGLYLQRVNPDGTRHASGGAITGIEPHDVQIYQPEKP